MITGTHPGKYPTVGLKMETGLLGRGKAFNVLLGLDIQPGCRAGLNG
jgi:hypothetical protein